MKNCPKCGKKVPAEAQYCPHCGARLDSSQPAHHQRAVIRQEAHLQKKHHWLWWLLLLVVIIAGVGFYFASRDDGDSTATTNSPTNGTATDSSVAVSSGSTTGSSATSTSSADSRTLTTDIGPKTTAAAVIYYAAQSGVSHWHGVLNTDGVTVALSTDDDLLDSLSEQGQGMAYLVYGYHDVASDDETDFVYTLDKDDTVNIYTLPDDYDSDNTYDPVASVSKSAIVNYLNDHHEGGAVQALSNKVDIDK